LKDAPNCRHEGQAPVRADSPALSRRKFLRLAGTTAAIGYLLKNVSADELADAIRAAHAGRPTLAPEAAQALIQTATQSPEPGYDLTEREREGLASLDDAEEVS